MAETTITGLPNATTPLDGTERVPMDQNGATVDASTQAIANLADGAISSAVAAHVAAADPHPGYLTQAEGDSRYRQSATALSDSDIPSGIARDSEVAAAIGAHEAAADPHPGYLTAAEGNAAYATAAQGTLASTAIQPGNAALTDARTPTAHKTTHATGGTDALTPGDIGAATAAQGSLAATAVQPGSLATVATSGAYGDLSGRPTLGTAAAAASTDFAPAAQGVTNGNSHNHDGGDGAQIAYNSLSGLPTLGTAAAQNVGAGAGNVVQLDNAAKLPAVDGSQLTNLPAVVSDPTGITGADAVTNIISLTQAEYDAIATPSATTLYVITS
jgi:hypothetical protein